MHLTDQQLEKFASDGLLVIEDFLTSYEVALIRSSCAKLVDEMDPREHRCVFSTVTHDNIQDDYFLDSGDKIRYFFESDAAFDEETGDLKGDKAGSLNKMGHALHWIEPNFKKITFSEKMKDVARSIGLLDPVVVQGMYIFKQPHIGGEVTPHQDGTFLNNDPLKLFGFWFPIDDATLENGCLWYVPGSHRHPITRRFVRTKREGGGVKMVIEGENPEVGDEEWVPAPVKKGSLVLIHGQVMHKSEQNRSTKPRHAYTFHMVESKGSVYSDKNWLQPTEELPFPKLFDN